MPYKNLHILVLLREVNDPRPPARVTTRGAGISDRGLRRVPNQADLVALEEALRLKDSLGGAVTVLAMGPERLDDTLRLAFSLGADRGIRFWDHGLEGGDAVADARILARIVGILSPTLLFTGNRLADRGDDPVPALAAAATGAPCITAAVALTLKPQGVEALRKGDRGARQKVAAPFPCTVLFDEGQTPRYPSIEAITRSLTAPIEEWELADLGLPFWEVGATGAYLTTAEFGTPRPDPVRLVTPDPQLPAFERIISLLSGGIKAREGKTHLLSADETTTELLRIFREEGIAPEAAS
ncbi:electron transfer flavoprotein subunit beta [Geobacter sp.]|uniref:electron transfer flavoprotein subunit beta/FixA family protein n=1 Tax=Geobacter sp. TaxID=46610 RepID=UPI0027B9C7F4|nr:electron transfer flavoprotein subunit beta [Geobacter sp.]